MTSNTLCNVRLATTQAGLLTGWVTFVLGLPPPSQPVKAPSSQRVNLSDGGQALRGYESVTLFWDRVDFFQARVIRKLVEDVGNGLIYATVDKSWDMQSGLGNWIDVSGRPHMPEFIPVAGTGGQVYDSISLFINDVQVLSDPASGV